MCLDSVLVVPGARKQYFGVFFGEGLLFASYHTPKDNWCRGQITHLHKHLAVNLLCVPI